MKKIKTYLTLLIIFILLAYWPFIFIRNKTRTYLLERKSSKTKGVVINERNFMGNSPVSHTFSYSYTFRVNGKIFHGITGNPASKIGDTVIVRYAISFPSINEMIE